MIISNLFAAMCGVSTLFAVAILSRNWILAAFVGWAVQCALLSIAASLEEIKKAIQKK